MAFLALTPAEKEARAEAADTDLDATAREPTSAGNISGALDQFLTQRGLSLINDPISDKLGTYIPPAIGRSCKMNKSKDSLVGATYNYGDR